MKHALRSSVRTAGPRRGGTGAAGADLFWYLFILAMRHALLRVLSRLACALAHLASTVREAKFALLHFFVILCIFLFGAFIFFVLLCVRPDCGLCFYRYKIVSHHSVRSGRAVYRTVP